MMERVAEGAHNIAVKTKQFKHPKSSVKVLHETSAGTMWDSAEGVLMLTSPSTMQQHGRKQSFIGIEGWR